VLGETLAARCYGGQKLAVIGEKGRGAHEDPNRGWCGAAECWSSAGDEGEEQSRVELIGGDLLVQRGKTREGNERGEECGCCWASFVGREGGEGAG
jgi:hypothetical protein